MTLNRACYSPFPRSIQDFHYKSDRKTHDEARHPRHEGIRSYARPHGIDEGSFGDLNSHEILDLLLQ